MLDSSTGGGPRTWQRGRPPSRRSTLWATTARRNVSAVERIPSHVGQEHECGSYAPVDVLLFPEFKLGKDRVDVFLDRTLGNE